MSPTPTNTPKTTFISPSSVFLTIISLVFFKTNSVSERGKVWSWPGRGYFTVKTIHSNNSDHHAVTASFQDPKNLCVFLRSCLALPKDLRPFTEISDRHRKHTGPLLTGMLESRGAFLKMSDLLKTKMENPPLLPKNIQLNFTSSPKYIHGRMPAFFKMLLYPYSFTVCLMNVLWDEMFLPLLTRSPL